MSKSDIRKSISKLPNLTDFGVGLYENGKGLSKSEYKKQFKKEQERLLDSVESFDKTCTWLSQINKIKSINTKNTSYGLKHIAEKDIGYITNGGFIAAAIHCGFDFKVYDNFPNVEFNMSAKSINRLRFKLQRISEPGLFYKWLMSQLNRNDAIGDLAKIVQTDKSFPISCDDLDMLKDLFFPKCVVQPFEKLTEQLITKLPAHSAAKLLKPLCFHKIRFCSKSSRWFGLDNNYWKPFSKSKITEIITNIMKENGCPDFSMRYLNSVIFFLKYELLQEDWILLKDCVPSDIKQALEQAFREFSKN